MPATRTSAVGDLLKRFRLAAGLTQEQLAERAGLSARGLSDIERGLKPRPHRDTLTLLADALALGPAERTALATVARGRAATPGDLAATPAGFATVEQSAHPTAAPLIGRDDEWKRMLGEWQRAAAGASRMLVVAGEAGIGKTRLAEELLRWASSRGTVTAVARCYSRSIDFSSVCPEAAYRPPILGTLGRS